MQRPQRRLTISNDSEPIAPDVNLNVRRRRSRTSSGGGDFLNKEFRESTSGSRAKVKSRRKVNAKIISRVKAKKKIKLPKSQKPPIKSLQKAIVLAPFHTLKKCFQTRLINLYSIEKMKKINHKMKMAKKPNTSFEYDVIEIKPSLGKIKKEPVTLKSHQQSPSKEKNSKNHPGKSGNYCQCGINHNKTEEKSSHFAQPEPTMRRRRTRSHITKDPTSPEFLIPSTFSSKGKSKKRRILSQSFTPTILKAELSIPPILKSEENFFSAGRSDLSISVISSPSKAESWETYTDSPLSKEEYLQGSLAISTTSFDSYTEIDQYERNRPHCMEQITSKNLPLKKNLDALQSESTTVLVSPNDLLPRQKNSESRHLIMAGIKPSEEGISDFMDREPQTQIIASIETSQHLHPLRRQSKTKEKPATEAEPVKACSLRLSQQNQEELTINLPRNRNENRRFSQSSQRSTKASRLSKVSSEISTNVDERSNQEKRDTPSATKFGSGITDIMPSTYKDKTGTYMEDSSSDRGYTEYESIEPKPVSSNRLPTTFENKRISQDRFSSKGDKLENKGDNENPNQSEDGFWVEDIEASGLPEEQSEISSIDIIPGLNTGSSVPHEDFRDSRVPQEKDSCFIFGERNSAARMGESCEFSFGVNWPMSDDEDSDLGHRFF